MQTSKSFLQIPTQVLLYLSLLVFSGTTGFSQALTLDINEMESTMRNLMTFDRGQYVQQWLLLGKIPAKWNKGMDKDFLLEAEGEANIRPQEKQTVKLADGSELRWRKLQNPSKIINLADFYRDVQLKDPVENIVYYAYGIINRQNAGRALLTMGSEGGVKVWLNGKLVYRNMDFREVEADQDLVEVELKGGDNYLLFKFVYSAWGKAFTTRIVEDANVYENTFQKVQLALNDNTKTNILTLKSKPLFNTITKYQPIQVKVYKAGGKSVLEKTIQRGDSISLKYTDWSDGPYEIKYTYYGLTGISSTAYINWFKGDILQFARDLVETAPDKNSKNPEEITHRMLADFVNYRLDNDFNTTDQYKKSLLHPLLMEFDEMKSKNQIRPGGFIRLAYIDEIDGTPQFCRCYLPPNYDPSKKSAMVVFLHGYNNENPDYVRWWFADKRHDFNVDRYNYILIEPHGRGNASYVGIGDKDVMKCIQMAKEKFNTDNDRVYLTGASMGGGGTWRVASLHPELFAAIAPVYGGWDFRNTMTKDNLKKLPVTEEFIRDKNTTTCQFESLLHMPVLALHGDKDDLVNVENTRYLVRMLQRWGYNIRYIEVPGKGHENLDKDDIIYPWLLQHTRINSPTHVRVRAANLCSASAYWVKITQRTNSWEMMNVEAEVLDNNIILVNSDNVLELILTPDRKMIRPNQPINVIWNGEIVTYNKLEGNAVTLRSKNMVSEDIHKSPQLAGPISDFTNTPFALVIGTISKDLLMQKIIEMKALSFVNYWENWQKVKPRILYDTEISEADMKNYSLFLIGGPNENMVSQRMEKLLPFKITPKTISIREKEFQAPNSFLEAIYPNPFNAERYIRLVAPTSYEGMFFYNPNNEVLSNFDYAIVDGIIPNLANSGRKIGIASGLFDYNWKLEVDNGEMNTQTNDAVK